MRRARPADRGMTRRGDVSGRCGAQLWLRRNWASRSSLLCFFAMRSRDRCSWARARRTERSARHAEKRCQTPTTLDFAHWLKRCTIGYSVARMPRPRKIANHPGPGVTSMTTPARTITPPRKDTNTLCTRRSTGWRPVKARNRVSAWCKRPSRWPCSISFSIPTGTPCS